MFTCVVQLLQGEAVAGLGYLLPTLCIIKSQQQELLDQQAPLTVTQSLVRALLDGINGRFGTVFDDTKAQLASAVHPKFKLDWVDNQFQKALLVEQMKHAVEAEQRRNAAQQDATTSLERESHQDQATAATPTAKDFFARIASRRNATVARPDGDAEVDAYLSDRSTDLSSLEAYPNICQVYLHLNTGLPASAAVECDLFSLGGRVFSPLRSRLSSEHFEMMLFLRTAGKW